MNTYTRLVPLTQGKFATVDACDYDFLMQWRWCAMKSESKVEYWRACRNAKFPERKRVIYMHWEIAKRAGLPDAPEYDHRDRNPLNNTRVNLRPANRSLNNANRGKYPGKSSKFKGVCWDKCKNKWLARIKVQREYIFLGRYDDESDAALAYDKAARKYFGEFACLNFP